MVTRKAPEPPAPANLATQQMRAAIPKLQRRIAELNSVDLTTVRGRGEPQFDSLIQKIDDTLIDIFGNSSAEYRRYNIDSLDTASFSFFGEDTSHHEIIEGYRRGIEQAVSTLQTIIELFQEKLADSVESDVSTKLSQKFGILRADSQLGSDFSACENDFGGLGLIFFDIDHFKALNTKYTETVVDQFILVPFQKLLIELTHSRGFAYSVGGDEFLLLLRNVDPNETLAFANRLLEAMRKHRFSVNGAVETLSISVGVACHPSDAQTSIELRKLANAAENKAKRDGRNRVICSE